MVRLVTVATHSDGYFPWLIESCKRYNTQLEVLGWGEKWQGFTWRFGLMIDYLKSVDPDELICFIDAYDVILLRNLDEIVKYYHDVIEMSNKKIIMSQEIIDPGYYLHYFNQIYFGKCKNSFICAGTYMGIASDILKLLLEAYKNQENDNDDQVILTQYCKDNPDVFYLDTDQNFFLVIGTHSCDLTKNKNIEITNNSLSYMNSKPFFFHGPGNRKMDDLVKKLNYTITDNDIEKINKDLKIINIKKTWYYVIKNPYIKYLFVIVLIFVIFCFWKKIRLEKNI